MNYAVAFLVILAGPIAMVVGSNMIRADEELGRTGVHASGTVVHFDDVSKQSQRRMKVEFTAADGSLHAVWAAVDHDQKPEPGEEVTVVYSGEDPDKAIVEGYESDGVWWRGVGTVLTALFGGLGVLMVLAFLWGYLGMVIKNRGR